MVFFRSGIWKITNLLILFLVFSCTSYCLSDMEASRVPKTKDYRLKMNTDWVTRMYFDTERQDSLEDIYSFYSWLTVKAKLKFPKEQMTFFVSADAREQFEGNSSVFEHEFEPLLRELYFQKRFDNAQFFIGRKDVTWGKLDDFTMLDIINAQDHTEFLLIDKKTRKIPQMMLKGDYFFGDNFLEVIYMPWFTPNEVDYFNTDWSIFRNTKKSIVKGTYSSATKQRVSDLNVRDDLINYALKNSEWAIRIGSNKERFDFSFYYMNIHDRRASLRGVTSAATQARAFLYNPNNTTLTDLVAAPGNPDDFNLIPQHDRIQVIGADFETTIGDFGLRGEAAILLKPMYLDNDFQLVKRSTFDFGIGIDHMTSDQLYLNLQFITHMIYKGDTLYARKSFEHQLVGLFSKEFMRGDLIPAFYWAYNFTYKDYFMNPKITYKYNGNISLTAGAFFFGGVETSLFGHYDKNDLYYFMMRYQY